jgi:hypothetical protein
VSVSEKHKITLCSWDSSKLFALNNFSLEVYINCVPYEMHFLAFSAAKPLGILVNNDLIRNKLKLKEIQLEFAELDWSFIKAAVYSLNFIKTE